MDGWMDSSLSDLMLVIGFLTKFVSLIALSHKWCTMHCIS